MLNNYRMKEEIGENIKKEASKIFPLNNVMVRKVKMLKRPKFDLTKLMELYQERPEDVSKAKKGAEGEKEEEPKNKLAA